MRQDPKVLDLETQLEIKDVLLRAKEQELGVLRQATAEAIERRAAAEQKLSTQPPPPPPPSKPIPATTKYWCAMPANDSNALQAEVEAGCGRWAAAGSFWLAGLGTALAVVVTVSAILTWTRNWADYWGWVLLGIPAALLWWALGPVLALFWVGLGVLLLTKGVRAIGLVFTDRRRTRLLEERRVAVALKREAAEEQERLAPIIQELDRELKS